MKTRHKIMKLCLTANEYKSVAHIHKRYANDVSLSAFCREVLVSTRIHPYNYINANLLDRPVGIEDTGPLRNNMEKRYHSKCRLVASFVLMLDHSNFITEAISKDESLYNELIDFLRGYSFNPENKRREYKTSDSFQSDLDEEENLSSNSKRSKIITIRLSPDEDSEIIQSYNVSLNQYKMSFPEFSRCIILGKIKQPKCSTFEEDTYELYKHRFFDEPVVPGFQTYLHYESQVIAALIMLLNFDPILKKVVADNSEKFKALTEMMWGYSFDQVAQIKSPLDPIYFDHYDRVINAKYYR